jgi:hypothetical protein
MLYWQIVYILRSCAIATIATHKKRVYKLWWNQELDCLKEQANDPQFFKQLEDQGLDPFFYEYNWACLWSAHLQILV